MISYSEVSFRWDLVTAICFLLLQFNHHPWVANHLWLANDLLLLNELVFPSLINLTAQLISVQMTSWFPKMYSFQLSGWVFPFIFHACHYCAVMGVGFKWLCIQYVLEMCKELLLKPLEGIRHFKNGSHGKRLCVKWCERDTLRKVKRLV